MYNIKMLESAVIAAIELSESCTSDSRSDCRDVFHVIKYVRAAVRDYPNRSNSLEEMFNVLSMHTARLQKIAGGKITEHIIVSDSGEVFPLPITNPYASLAHLIRQKLQKKDRQNYLHLHKIADLFMHRFSEYSDMADANSNLNNRKMRDCLLYACFLVLGRYVSLLEQAMKSGRIPYDEITV